MSPGEGGENEASLSLPCGRQNSLRKYERLSYEVLKVHEVGNFPVLPGKAKNFQNYVYLSLP